MDTIRVHLNNGEIVTIEEVDFNVIKQATYNVKAFTFNTCVIMVDNIVWIEKVK